MSEPRLWPPPHGQGSGGSDRSAGYPRERPDFEPPPPWARPASGIPAQGGPPPSPRPYGSPPPSSAPRPAPKRSLLILLAVVIALVAGALGAAAGSYLTLRYAPPVSVEPLPPPEDDLGGDVEAFAEPQNVAKVAEVLLPSVVHIKVSAGGSRATGSGFVIRKDGHILTNNHVVEIASESGTITVAFEDGRETTARIVGRSPSYDLAVIKVDDTRNLRPVALGDSNKLEVGEPIVAVGAPLGLHGTVTSGIVSARNRPVTAGGADESSFINAIQTDAAINPGNSGGPLVNMKAEVIGVNTAIATVGGETGPFGQQQQSGNIGLGFAIPMNQARRTANQLIENGKAVFPVIGASLDGRFSGPGARLASVDPGSGAREAGLREGDLVVSINGHRVTGSDDLIVQIRSRVPGEQVAIDFKRDGKLQRVKVTLGEKVDE
ncbi:MAG TPA: trypsin-like peptidase domain-containing protein [Actinopolymorphaceae bacterium]